MTISLKRIWNLWEKVEKGWEGAKIAASKIESQEVPEVAKKEKPYERPTLTISKIETPSEMNTLEAEKEFVPGKDKDAKVMQLKAEYAKLEESLMELELEPEVEEAFMTPDVGTSVLGRSMFTGAALQPPNGYERNFHPDPQAPEEGSGFQDQDSSATIVAPQRFIPRESLNRQRLAKIRQ